MGYSPQQIDAMSLWQYTAVVDGFIRANDPKSNDRLSESEKDDLFGFIKEQS